MKVKDIKIEKRNTKIFCLDCNTELFRLTVEMETLNRRYITKNGVVRQVKAYNKLWYCPKCDKYYK